MLGPLLPPLHLQLMGSALYALGDFEGAKTALKQSLGCARWAGLACDAWVLLPAARLLLPAEGRAHWSAAFAASAGII